VVRLQLLLLAQLLHKLLDLPALLSTVALGVVHWAPWTTLITTGELSRPLYATWATSRYSISIGGSTSQWLVLAGGLLLLFLFTAALSSGICIGLTGLPCLWDRF
jgi:hypothetical protein